MKKIIDGLLGGTEGTLLALTPASLLLNADQPASFWELARECSLTHGATLCGYMETPPPARRGEHPVPKVTMNPPNKATRRSWYGTQLVIVRTDERLRAARSAVAVPEIVF